MMILARNRKYSQGYPDISIQYLELMIIIMIMMMMLMIMMMIKMMMMMMMMMMATRLSGSILSYYWRSS